MSRIVPLGAASVGSSSLREWCARRADEHAAELDAAGDPLGEAASYYRPLAARWRSAEIVRTQFAYLPPEVGLRFGRADLQRVWSGTWDACEVDGAGCVRRPGGQWVTV